MHWGVFSEEHLRVIHNKCEFKSRYGHFEEVEYVMLLPGIERQFLGYPSRCLLYAYHLDLFQYVDCKVEKHQKASRYRATAAAEE